MLLRIGFFILALCGVIGCAPLPPVFPVDSVPAESPPVLAPSPPIVIPDAPPVPAAVVETSATVVLPLDTVAPTEHRMLQKQLPNSLRRPLRVGLLFGKSTHRITGSGSWTVQFDGKRSAHLQNFLSLIFSKGQVHVRDSQGTWVGSDERVEIAPWDNESTVVLDGKGFRGNLEFSALGNGIQTVNIIDVEDYLKGVVPHEIGRLDNSGSEALKAQAVAARTYAFRHFGSRISQGFDVYADVRDQVYEGRNGEYALSNQAVEATRGVIMEYQGKMIDAYYHSTCAGHTESVATWDRSSIPYLSSVPDHDSQGNTWCSESSYRKWEVRIADSDLASLVRKNAATAKADKVFSFSRIEQIFILDRLPGGRVGNLLVATDNGSLQVKGDRTRWLFKQGTKILPSANFDIAHTAGQWVFTGKGFGHGIGMCQMGARGRSRAGQPYRDILWHYYQGIDLVYYHE